MEDAQKGRSQQTKEEQEELERFKVFGLSPHQRKPACRVALEMRAPGSGSAPPAPSPTSSTFVCCRSVAELWGDGAGPSLLRRLDAWAQR